MNKKTRMKHILDGMQKALSMTRQGEDVLELEYIAEDTGEEYVRIAFRDPYEDTRIGFERMICVTASSELAIMEQVIKSLK